MTDRQRAHELMTEGWGLPCRLVLDARGVILALDGEPKALRQLGLEEAQGEALVRHVQDAALRERLLAHVARVEGVEQLPLLFEGPEGHSWLRVQAHARAELTCVAITQDLAFGEALERLRRDEARYRSLVEQVAETVLVHDMQGRLVDVNEAACQALGYSREELLRAQVSDVEMSVKPGSLTGIWNRMTPGKPITIEGTHRRKDGSTFPVEVRLALCDVRGELLMMAVCRDTSMRKYTDEHLRLLNAQLKEARDRALDASRVKSAFLANMSHELRTPLNAIIGYAELLHEDFAEAEDAGAVRDLGHIQQAAHHLLGLINDVLDLSKIEAGRMELDIGEYSLDAVLEDCQATLTPLAQRHSNTLRVERGPLPTRLRGDAMRLRQVIINLLSNANKFTQSGDITLRAEAITHRAQPWVRLRVQDTGIGIAPEQLEQLFEPFRQADHALARRQEGTGLGLTISRELCRMMGGELRASSVVGEGSVFEVLIPVLVEDRGDYSSGGYRSDDPTPAPVSPDATVALIIDHDEASAQALTRALTREGLRAVHTTDAREGLARLRALRPGIIVLAADMPHDEGLNALETLRHDPTVAHLPALVISDSPARDDEARELGATALTTRPVSRDVLRAFLREHGAFPNASVLIVDDDPVSREILERTLAALGWALTSVSDAEAALQALERASYDLIVTDLMMPGLGGFGLLDKLARRPQGGPPVAVVTALPLDGGLKRRLARGGSHAAFQKGAYAVGLLLRELTQLVRDHQRAREEVAP